MLGAELLERVLGIGLARGGDFAEVYLQDRTITSISLEDQKIERLQAGRERGAGVRVVVGAVTGFAYTDDLSEASLLRAADVASARHTRRRYPRRRRRRCFSHRPPARELYGRDGDEISGQRAGGDRRRGRHGDVDTRPRRTKRVQRSAYRTRTHYRRAARVAAVGRCLCDRGHADIHTNRRRLGVTADVRVANRNRSRDTVQSTRPTACHAFD